jgi:hypothetical protein
VAKKKTYTPRGAGANNSFRPRPAAAAAPAPAPSVPTPVAPMPSADDMVAVNAWLTDYYTQLEDIDFDTKFSKGQNDKRAVENRSASDDAMAARGIFRSSLRDAAVYDIEATRSLANTFLDTKLQEAVTQGTTRKGTLAQSKLAFETGMLAK